MMSKLITLAIASIGLASFAGADVAQQGGPNATSQAPGSTPSTVAYTQPTSIDAAVLAKLHQTNQNEINAGHLAQSNSQSPAVKQYGEKLVQDHQQADQKVQQIASQLKVNLEAPAEAKVADQKHEAMLNDLKTLSGPAFDKKFSKAMLTDHEHDIAALEKKQSQLPANDPVRQLIAELLPTLKQHEQIAKNLTAKSS